MTIRLADAEPFARGGNRLCFVHPQDPARCLKVRRPDFSLEQLRRGKNIFKRLRPLHSFDDNAEEYRVIQQMQKHHGPGVFRHVYRCFGFVDTDLGTALDCELIRDASGAVSISLKQYLWEKGDTAEFRRSLSEFTDFLRTSMIATRELLAHNIAVQQDGERIERLVLIDGLGSPNLLPYRWLPQLVRQRKVQRRLKRFERRLNEFIGRCAQGIMPSKVGMLLHRG